MDEYVGEITLLQNGRVSVPYGLFIFRRAEKFVGNEFLRACQNDAEFSRYYLMSGRIVVWSMYFALTYAIECECSKLFDDIIIAAKFVNPFVLCEFYEINNNEGRRRCLFRIHHDESAVIHVPGSVTMKFLSELSFTEFVHEVYMKNYSYLDIPYTSKRA